MNSDGTVEVVYWKLDKSGNNPDLNAPAFVLKIDQKKGMMKLTKYFDGFHESPGPLGFSLKISEFDKLLNNNPYILRSYPKPKLFN